MPVRADAPCGRVDLPRVWLGKETDVTKIKTSERVLRDGDYVGEAGKVYRNVSRPPLRWPADKAATQGRRTPQASAQGHGAGPCELFLLYPQDRAGYHYVHHFC